MMERDILDHTLRRKLHGISAEPPKDLWDAIESDLNSMPVKQPIAKRTMLLKRNVLRYGVAASIMIASVAVGLYKSQEPILVSELIEKVSEQPVQTDTTTPSNSADFLQNAAPLQEISALAASTQKSTTSTSNVVANKLAASAKPDPRETITTEVPHKQSDPIEISTDNNTDSRTASRTVSPLETTNVTSVSGDPKDGQTEPIQQQTPQFTQTKTKSPDWYNEIDKPISKRRNNRKSSSLYAANIGFGSSSVNVSSLATRSMSEFKVNEIVLSTGHVGSVSREYQPESLRHHAPLAFGLSFSWGIGQHFDIETGLTYTFMKSDADIDGDLFSYQQKQELHYLGIPVSVKYNALGGTHWAVYARAGAMVEQGIYGKFSTKYTQEKAPADGNDSYALDINGVQSSLSIGVGGEYKFTKLLGVYIEPSLNYYFGTDSQPVSYRTENPLHFGLKAGFRINFN